jgi:thiol-disulfide isomerase/thioredoxin
MKIKTSRMRTSLFLLIFLVTNLSFGQVKFFQGTWNELLAEAKKKNKPIWVDFYAVWCGPCKMMAKNTFEDVRVGEFSNANYIAYKIDAEKGEGPELADKYQVNAYPTIVFLDANGNHIKNSVGYKTPEQFIAELQQNMNIKKEGTAQETPVNFFQGTWADLLKEAQKTGKPFWVDFYAVWCGPCKMMSSRTFKDNAVGAYSNQNFIAYKLDCEKGEGPQLANKYKIKAYPTIIAFDALGNEVDRYVGFMDAFQFQEWLKKVQEKTGKKGKSHGNNNTPVYQFLDYWKLKDPLYQQVKAQVLSDEEQKKRYEQAYQLGIKRDDYSYEDLVQRWSVESKKSYIWKYDLGFYLGAKKYDKVIEIVEPLFEAQQLSEQELHWIALELLKVEYSKPEVIKWVNASIRLNNTAEKMDTKAGLYYLLGKSEDALDAAQQSLKMNKQLESAQIIKTLANQALIAKSQ